LSSEGENGAGPQGEKGDPLQGTSPSIRKSGKKGGEGRAKKRERKGTGSGVFKQKEKGLLLNANKMGRKLLLRKTRGKMFLERFSRNYPRSRRAGNVQKGKGGKELAQSKKKRGGGPVGSRHVGKEKRTATPAQSQKKLDAELRHKWVPEGKPRRRENGAARKKSTENFSGKRDIRFWHVEGEGRWGG